MTTEQYKNCRRQVEVIERKISHISARIRGVDSKVQSLRKTLSSGYEERKKRSDKGFVRQREHAFGVERNEGKLQAQEFLLNSLEQQRTRLREALRAKLAECRNLASSPGSRDQKTREAAARQKIADPAYWRDHDPALHEEVQADFEALYPR